MSDSESMSEDQSLESQNEESDNDLEEESEDEEQSDEEETSDKDDIPFNKDGKKKDLLQKYKELKGKQLFVQFPKKLPLKPQEVEQYVKKLNESIVKVHRPRQKSVRHCLIEFENEADRTKAMKKLSKVEVDGKKLIVQLPKTESEDYLKKISEYQKKKREKMLEKKQAKKLAKQNDNAKFTSTLNISNIPSSATVTDIKALFPEAVELRFTVAKGMEDTSLAIITLPSSKDATLAKRKHLKIGENKLEINYAISKGKKETKEAKKNKKKQKKNNKQKPTDATKNLEEKDNKDKDLEVPTFSPKIKENEKKPKPKIKQLKRKVDDEETTKTEKVLAPKKAKKVKQEVKKPIATQSLKENGEQKQKNKENKKKPKQESKNKKQISKNTNVDAVKSKENGVIKKKKNKVVK